MKTAKELSESLRRADELATKATTCKRLSGGIRAIPANFLDLTVKERETLAKACALLDEISTAHSKAAKLRKHADEARNKREREVRAAMKDTFDQLATTADKVALIALEKSYTFDRDGVGSDLKTRHDATYLLGTVFNDCLGSIAYEVEADARRRAITLPAALAAAWQRFTERRAALQDKHAQAIVRVDRLLAAATSGSQP